VTTTPRNAMPVLLLGIDDAWQRLWARIAGLGTDEYRWEPVPGCWTVRSDDGRWLADGSDTDPDPAPVTTIAWRLWHIGSDCLASYVSRSLGDWPLPVRGHEWFGEADSALPVLQTAFETFRSRIEALGEDGLWQPLGPQWGPYAESTWADLVVHALDELAHHGAEVALLRDLYPRLSERAEGAALTGA
jgi:DinB family protein